MKMITELLKTTDKEERIAALADYRRILRETEPGTEDLHRLREVKRELNLSDADIEADAQAVRELAGLEQSRKAFDREAAREDERAKALPATLAEIADVVRDALLLAPSLAHVCGAADSIILNCNWLAGTDKNQLVNRVQASVATFGRLPDPQAAVQRSHRIEQNIQALKRARPLAFA